MTPQEAPLRAAQRTIALAPMINRRRSVRSPNFEVLPSLCLPPVDRCKGVSPSPGGKIASSRKGLRRRRPGADRCRHDGANTGNGLQSKRILVLLGATGDLGI